MDEPWLLIEAPTGQLCFANREEFDKYIREYAAFYQAILDGIRGPEWARKSPENYFMSALQQAAATANWLSQNHPPESAPANFRNSIEDRMRQLPDHTSENAHHIATIFQRLGLAGASGAAASYSGTGLGEAMQFPDTLSGVMEYAFLKYKVDLESTQAVEAELQTIRAKYSQHFIADRKQIDALFEEMNTANQRAETQKENLATWWMHRHEKFRETATEKLDAALLGFQTTEDTFKERMKLDRPREYWSRKADGHEKWSCINGAIAIIWLIAAGILSVLGIWWLFEKAIELTVESDIPATALATLGAMGLTGTTVAFWVARLLVRLWLSQMHLGMDARERVTMIESYLALTAEGAVDDKHREIVLNSIFRPTQDGIVKDDASADPTLAGLVARLAAR